MRRDEPVVAGAQRQVDRLVAVGGDVRRDIDLHHLACLLGRHQHRPVERDRRGEMVGFRRHRPGKHVPDRLARHGRHGMHEAALHGHQRHVGAAVVDEQRALGADELDPGARVIGIAGRQDPAGADGKDDAVVHRHGDERRVWRVVLVPVHV